MLQTQVAHNARLYRVTFDPNTKAVETIERYSRHVLTSYAKDNETHFAMTPSDKPFFRRVWLRQLGRQLGFDYHRIVLKARALLNAGRSVEIMPQQNARAIRKGQHLFTKRMPDAIERELKQMAELGLSF